MRDRYGRVLIGLVALAFAAPSFAKDEPDTSGVICKDGSTAKGGRGACRGHGGVDKVATAKAAGGSTGAATETKGEQAKAAAKADEKAAEMTVVCKDGSTAKGGRGACRGHGGVDKGTTARSEAAAPAPPPAKPPAATPAVPPAPAAPSARAIPPVPPASAAPGPVATQRAGEAMDKKGPPTARCKDGTLSHAKHHTGACARHGGVQEWLDKTEQK